MENLKVKRVETSRDSTIIIHYNGEVLNVQKSNRPQDYKRLSKLIEEKDTEGIIVAYGDIKRAIEGFTNSKFSVAQGQLIDKDGCIIPMTLAKKFMQFKEADENFMPFWRFWQKLKRNPSENSKQQLFTFIEKNNIPITSLGDLLLEKGVKMLQDGSLVDDYTGKFDNSIGMIVEMPRKDVEDNPEKTCSAGLHVAAPDYVRSTYNHSVIIQCSVSPTDVVSVPVDYNATKMRVCRYQVMGLGKKSQIDKLVVNMKDLFELPKVEERNNHNYDHVPTNTFTDMMKLTASKIIEFVKSKTGKTIKLNPKNKQGIAKKAEEILSKSRMTDLPVSESKKENKIEFTNKTCKEIIEITSKIIKDAENLAGNDPRRGKFIAKITPLLKAKGYVIVD